MVAQWLVGYSFVLRNEKQVKSKEPPIERRPAMKTGLSNEELFASIAKATGRVANTLNRNKTVPIQNIFLSMMNSI